MIGALIGALIGHKLGERYLSNARETPVWTGHIGGDIGKPAVSLCKIRWRGRMHYRLYVVTEGEAALVGESYSYPVMLGSLQVWKKYLDKGGTVAKWRMRNVQRARELRELEESWLA